MGVARPRLAMGFRDDREAMRARVEALEDELEALRKENDALRGRDALAGGAGAWFLGAPATIRAERVVDGELDASTHELLVEEARARFGALGRVTRVGRSFAWSVGPPASTRTIEVSAAPRRGRTHIRVQEQLGQVAGAWMGGGVAGFGGLLGLLLTGVVLLGLRLPAALAPFLVVGWTGAVWLAIRRAYRGLARRRLAELAACADALAGLTEDAGDARPGARVRAPDGAADPGDRRDAGTGDPERRAGEQARRGRREG